MTYVHTICTMCMSGTDHITLQTHIHFGDSNNCELKLNIISADKQCFISGALLIIINYNGNVFCYDIKDKLLSVIYFYTML